MNRADRLVAGCFGKGTTLLQQAGKGFRTDRHEALDPGARRIDQAETLVDEVSEPSGGFPPVHGLNRCWPGSGGRFDIAGKRLRQAFDCGRVIGRPVRFPQRLQVLGRGAEPMAELAEQFLLLIPDLQQLAVALL